MLRVMAVSVVLLSVAACSRQDAFVPKPRSVSTTDSVYADAVTWARADQSRYVASVAATHSMEPFVNEHSLVLMVRYSGQPIQTGAVVEFDRGDALRVLHVVTDQTETDAYLSGYNNHISDGWYAKSRIHGIMVGQLYLP